MVERTDSGANEANRCHLQHCGTGARMRVSVAEVKVSNANRPSDDDPSKSHSIAATTNCVSIVSRMEPLPGR